MSRYDLTDFEWRGIEPLLPNKPRGVLRVDDRGVLNGIFWVLRSGAPRAAGGAAAGLCSGLRLAAEILPLADSVRARGGNFLTGSGVG